jgi:lipoate-protein ligase A
MLFLLDRDHRDGLFNMALDELLAGEVESGRLEAFVRLYGWRPPAVSLGRNQRADEVDAAACRRDGVDVVRRPTGGRAVFHRDELTYSLAAGIGHIIFGGSAMDAYRAIGRGLCRGLRMLGLDAELTRASTKLGPRASTKLGPRASVPNARSGLSPSCFAASGRYELAVGGRKIVGSAQRRFASSFLQQGSVLLAQGQDHEYFRNPAPPGSFITAERELGRRVAWDEAAEAMARGMAEEWGVKLEGHEPDREVLERAGALAAERSEKPT